jgi:hypothetical protein
MEHNMIVCPWCGTNYSAFQPNCRNCGGPMPTPPSRPVADADDEIEMSVPAPPPPPRPIADNYVWKLMGTDGWSIACGVFTFIGVIFSFIGLALTLAIITAFVGLPFLLFGLIFLGVGVYGLRTRYAEKRRIVEVLRHGQAAPGLIVGTEINANVRVNGRHPWDIVYQFQVDGRNFEGRTTTLNRPGPQLQPGRAACVLYMPNAPEHNSLYPHP